MSRDEVFESLRKAHIRSWGTGYDSHRLGIKEMHPDVRQKFFNWRWEWWNNVMKHFPEQKASQCP